MSKNTTSLKDFSRAEGWLNIDASTKTATELKNIIATLSSYNTAFVIKNVDLTPLSDLKEIAKLASGRIIFEI